MFGNSDLFEIELIWLDLFEIEVVFFFNQLDHLQLECLVCLIKLKEKKTCSMVKVTWAYLSYGISYMSILVKKQKPKDCFRHCCLLEKFPFRYSLKMRQKISKLIQLEIYINFHSV